MKRKVIALSILFGILLLTACTATQASGWPLEKKLNPNGRSLWIVIADREIAKVFGKKMRELHISKKGYGFGALDSAESFINSGYPVVIAFSPDQISLKRIPERDRYLFFLSELNKALDNKKCVIVSRKVRLNIVREMLKDKDKEEWVTVSKIEEDSYISLIAAPNKRALEKAIARFFTLKEIPLEPIIFTAK